MTHGTEGFLLLASIGVLLGLMLILMVEVVPSWILAWLVT